MKYFFFRVKTPHPPLGFRGPWNVLFLPSEGFFLYGFLILTKLTLTTTPPPLREKPSLGSVSLQKKVSHMKTFPRVFLKTYRKNFSFDMPPGKKRPLAIFLKRLDFLKKGTLVRRDLFSRALRWASRRGEFFPPYYLPSLMPFPQRDPSGRRNDPSLL